MRVIPFPVIDPAATGQNILRLRLERGLSVRDLQAYFGFEEPQAIYKWQRGWGMSRRRLGKLTNLEFDEVEEIETGINKNPSFYLMLKICDALQISIFSLLSEEGYESFILNKLT